MLCLPPTLALPLAPGPVIAWTLFLAGVAPCVVFHPALTAERVRWAVDALGGGVGEGKGAGGAGAGGGDGQSQGRLWRYWRARAERWVLTDRLDDRIASSEIREVHVWEHERVERAWAERWVERRGAAAAAAQSERARGGPAAVPAVEAPPAGVWSAAHLTAADRQPWVRTIPLDAESLWKDDADAVAVGSAPGRGRTSPLAAMHSDEDVALEAHGTNGRVALLLQREWSFVPGDEWRVDFAGGWSPVGVDEGGWAVGKQVVWETD